MIQVYYGNGKGKTSAAVGAAIRAVGSGMRVLFVQFLKNGDSSECELLKRIEGIDLLIPNDKYTLFEKPDEERILKRAREYNSLIFNTVNEKSEEYGMIVFDEVLDILEFGYIVEEDFAAFLKKFKGETEAVLTGHRITERISVIADYVSEIKQIKHPYYLGAASRKGIEY